MRKQMSYYVQKLEEAGIDTSKFNLELNGVVLTPEKALESEGVVENTFIFDRNNFEKDIALNTMRFMKTGVWNVDKHVVEYGFDAHVRLALRNDDQTRNLINIAKTLSRIDERSREFKVLSSVYTPELYMTFLEYVRKFVTFHAHHSYPKTFDRTYVLGELMLMSDKVSTYKGKTNEDYKHILVYMNKMNRLIPTLNSSYLKKCKEWKEAYKAAAGYFTLSYLIKKGSFTTFGLSTLDVMFNALVCNREPWRMFMVLKENQDKIPELR